MASIVIQPQVTLQDRFDRYSSWYKLKCAIAWIIKLKNYLMKRYVTRQKSLTVSDVEGSEIEIIKQFQAYAFHEISIVQAKKRLPKSSKLAKLQPFIDSVGILRVGGRIQKAPVNYESRHPIIQGVSQLLKQSGSF